MAEIQVKDLIIDAIKNKKLSLLKELFETVPNVDIAEAMEEIDDVTQLIWVFRVITSEYTAFVFSELSPETQEKIINAFSDKDLIKLLENSFADDVTDTLEEMPANVASRILKVCPADLRKDVNQLLNYKDNTAGSIMTTEFIMMLDTLTVKEAIDEIRKKGKDAETIYTIFVRDEKRSFVGTVSLDDLIFAKDDEKLEDIMDRDFVSCKVNDDQEEVADMFKRYDLNAMAVTNKEGKIIGIITVDDVVDVIVEEATEDIAHLGQVSTMEQPYLKTPVWRLFVKCIPWIVVLMVLQVFSTLIMSSFEGALSRFIILTFFTAVICDAGGNSGGQTTTLIVRSIALNEFEKGDFKRVIWKEFRVALLLGGAVCLFGFGWLLFEMGLLGIGKSAFEATDTAVSNSVATYGKFPVMCVVAGLVSATLFVTILVSRMIGCMLPFFAKLIKKDPAVLCGPMTTTIVDVVSLLTYFLLWTFVFSPMLGL